MLRTTDLTIGGLRPIALEQEYCPFLLLDQDVLALADSRFLPRFSFPFTLRDPV